MEEKLKAYRRQKQRKEIIGNIKEFIVKMVVPQSRSNEKKADHVTIETDGINGMQNNNTNKNKTEEFVVSSSVSDNESIQSDNILSSEIEVENDDDEHNTPVAAAAAKKKTVLVYVTYLVYFLFWCTCYAIAIELGFGLVFLTISALCAIYLNTRTEPKLDGEISAYSVFNKDFRVIDGTLDAEQFDREMRYGPTSVR